MSRKMTDLTTAATQAGLKDPDLLLVARPDLPPAEAIADLKQRYPSAFPKHARDLSDAEFERRQLQRRPGWASVHVAPDEDQAAASAAAGSSGDASGEPRLAGNCHPFCRNPPQPVKVKPIRSENRTAPVADGLMKLF